MIPSADDPNDLLAMFWRDMEIVYDQAANSGVTLANLTSGGVPSAAILEYDNVEDWPAGSGVGYDFEMLARYEASPNWYEYIFAYDNLNGDVTAGTIGVENADGSAGVQVAYNDIAVTNGQAICFDLVASGQDPVTITYQARVDGNAAPGDVTNNVESITDNPGSMVESTSATVTVLEGMIGGPVTQTASTSPVVPGTFIDVAVSASNSSADLADALFLAPIDPDTHVRQRQRHRRRDAADRSLRRPVGGREGSDDLAAEAAGRAPEDVVAVAWAGPFMNGDLVDFGFQVQVMASSGEVQHDVALFDGATFVAELRR